MKKAFLTKAILVSMLAMTIVVPAVMAGTITLNWTSGYYSPPAGEFTATASSDLNYLVNNYNAKATVNGGFETFCLEYTEYISLGTAYNAAISDRARNGGLPSSAGGDPISIGTAWLYSQFASGTLEGYDYNVGLGRAASAGALQQAVWFLEGETGGSQNKFAELVMNQLKLDLTQVKADANGAYGVAVLNLTDGTGGLHQDQLVIAPVPEPATMLLLGSGLVGLAAFRKRFKK